MPGEGVGTSWRCPEVELGKMTNFNFDFFSDRIFRIPRSEAGQDCPGLDASGGALASLGTSRGPQTPPEHAATLVYASVGSPSVASIVYKPSWVAQRHSDAPHRPTSLNFPFLPLA